MGKKSTLTEQLAEFAITDRSSRLSKQDFRMVKLSVMDWIAAAQTGVTEENVKLLMNLSDEEGIKGDSVVIGQNKKTSALAAALLNGTESHAIDFDDIHDFLSLHLCSPVMPAALAAAEMVNASGMRFINGIINGIQIMVAISAGIMPAHYNLGRWHATGTIGIFGAAAAAGVVLGLTLEQMCNAFGISAGVCCGIQLNFGTMSKPMCAGLAAKHGLMAAVLAQRGFTGCKDIFDTDFLGNISAGKAEPERIIERLNSVPYGIHELRFKRYPCGAPTHSGIINCKKILADNDIMLDDIKKIIFEPYPRAIRLVGITHPTTGLQGKFSIPFTAAAQMVFGQVTIETFSDKNVRDPRIKRLLDCMEMVPNDEFTYSRGGKATIYLKDGRSFSNSTYLLGHPIDLDETEPDITAKYYEIMNPRRGYEAAVKLHSALTELEEIKEIHIISNLL